VLLVELPQQALGVLQIPDGFPRIIVFVIAFPFHQIFDFSVHPFFVEYSFDLVVFFVIAVVVSPLQV
jgi:hypothetical protein